MALSSPESQARYFLDKALVSAPLVRSRRLSAFLRFVSEEELAGRSDDLSQSLIASAVFGRGEEFNPQVDPVVRVQAGRLRRALSDYYGGPGNQDQLHIVIAKGSYSARFVPRERARPDAAPQERVSRTGRPRLAILPQLGATGREAGKALLFGLLDELAYSLARFRTLGVIAPSAVLEHGRKELDLPRLRSELDADFVLTGASAQQGNRLRIRLQLHDCESGVMLWGRRDDADLEHDDLFDLQDQIIAQIAATLADDYGVIAREFTRRARQKRSVSRSAHEAVLRSYILPHVMSPEVIRGTLARLEEAVTLDPTYAMAQALLAQAYMDSYTFGFEVENALQRGQMAAHRAIKLDPQSQHAHYAGAYAALLRRDRATMVLCSDRILELNPSAAHMCSSAGWWLTLAGETERGLKEIERSRPLHPNAPSWLHFAPWLVHYANRDYESALASALEFGLPEFFWGPTIRAATLAQLGRHEEAGAEVRALLAARGDFGEKAGHYLSSFILDEAEVEHVIEGLDKAGIPLLSESDRRE